MILEVAFWAFTTGGSMDPTTLIIGCLGCSSSHNEEVIADKFPSKVACEAAREIYWKKKGNKNTLAGECKREIAGWVEISK